MFDHSVSKLISLRFLLPEDIQHSLQMTDLITTFGSKPKKKKKKGKKAKSLGHETQIYSDSEQSQQTHIL